MILLLNDEPRKIGTSGNYLIRDDYAIERDLACEVNGPIIPSLYTRMIAYISKQCVDGYDAVRAYCTKYHDSVGEMCLC